MLLSELNDLLGTRINTQTTFEVFNAARLELKAMNKKLEKVLSIINEEE